MSEKLAVAVITINQIAQEKQVAQGKDKDKTLRNSEN